MTFGPGGAGAVGVDGPLTASLCQNEVVRGSNTVLSELQQTLMPLITSDSAVRRCKVFVWLGFRSEPLIDLRAASVSIAVRKSIDAPGYGVGHSPGPFGYNPAHPARDFASRDGSSRPWHSR